jgi:hypothetical protein
MRLRVDSGKSVDSLAGKIEDHRMALSIWILIFEAIVVYLLVLGAHSLRHRLGLMPFCALIGAVTAIMSWVTDAGLRVAVGAVTFNVGSTVFYTAILLAIFVIYVFDGPLKTRILTSTVIGVSVFMPIIAFVLNVQSAAVAGISVTDIPMPSLRINLASVLTTLADLVFLGVVWEMLGKSGFRLKLGLRTFLTLLGVMSLDVILFSTGAFLGTPIYWSVLKGTLVSRFCISFVAFPLLYLYIYLESRRKDVLLQDRPVLSILRRIENISEELQLARAEIERRKAAEQALQKALSEVKTLQGLIPICSGCKKVRDDKGYWEKIESYLSRNSDAAFSHGICPDCKEKYYPEISEAE